MVEGQRLSQSMETSPMKGLIAELMYQLLIELLSHMLMRLADWLSALPWL
jgi:hypothetical protein